MSADSAVTYTSVHSEARSWSIPSEDPYEEAAQQLFEQAPRSPEYVPENHIPVYIPEPEHPEDLVPAEDEAPIPPLSPSFLAPRIRPLSPRALEVEMRDVASAYYHSLHPSGTPPLLPIPLPAPSTSRRVDIPEADTPPRKRLLLTTPRPSGEVDVCTRESSEFCTRHHDAQKDRAAVRAEIEVLRRERLAYEQESMETRQALARSEAHCRALEARVTVLETEVHRHEWQRQAADDLAVQHIMRTQALEAGARVDTLEDTARSTAHGLGLMATIAMVQDKASTILLRECSYSEFLNANLWTSRGTRELFRNLSMQLMQMPWATLKKMMTDKYCPRGEIKKIETEMWNLKARALMWWPIVDDFQQLALMCSRMFPDEYDMIEQYYVACTI
ncbi:hypothetical protein Tco_0247515 [Tanacetum coccineum]